MPDITSVVSRRVAIVLAMAVLAAAWIITAGTPHASAAVSCDNTNHCYGEGADNTGTNTGIAGTINIGCLWEPNDGSFATNEIWDVTNNNAYWTEVGVISGRDGWNNYDNKNWFWADHRPVDPPNHINFHLVNTAAAGLSTNYYPYMYYAGNGNWPVYGGNSLFYFGESTSQASLNAGTAGTEYTSNQGSGLRDIGHVAALQVDYSSGWTPWGYGGAWYSLGPSEWIPGSYDHVGSTATWPHGPC